MSVSYVEGRDFASGGMAITDRSGNRVCIDHFVNDRTFVLDLEPGTSDVAITYEDAVKLAAWLLACMMAADLTEALAPPDA